MPVRHGEVHVVDSFFEFHEQFDVTRDELERVLEESQRETLLEVAVQQQPPDSSRPKSIEDVHFDTLYGFFPERIGAGKAIDIILEQRESEYVHLFDGYDHRIVTLEPRDLRHYAVTVSIDGSETEEDANVEAVEVVENLMTDGNIGAGEVLWGETVGRPSSGYNGSSWAIQVTIASFTKNLPVGDTLERIDRVESVEEVGFEQPRSLGSPASSTIQS